MSFRVGAVETCVLAKNRLRELEKEAAALSPTLAVPGDRNGARPLSFDRDQLGRFVREAWVRWAETQPSPKPSWLVPYDELAECDKEADRQIGEAVARWTIIGDAATGGLAVPDNETPPLPTGNVGEADEPSTWELLRDVRHFILAPAEDRLWPLVYRLDAALAAVSQRSAKP